MLLFFETHKKKNDSRKHSDFHDGQDEKICKLIGEQRGHTGQAVRVDEGEEENLVGC